ncbi:MAG: hypothetical protein PHH20_00070 [Candidatus Omnitrophica bacterium]|nr:hypothetical protein [Candidatus Omnitrophota bacterium]
MENFVSEKINNILGKEYKEHNVFSKLDEMISFYKSFSFSIFGFITQGTEAHCNIDSYLYSSIQGTLDSISNILRNGRINDSYALLRKYYDSIIINIYSTLYLNNNFSLENFVVDKIDSWLKGKEQLPEYRIMSQYIKNSDKLKPLTTLLYKDNRYKKIRDRCNDHTHYNFYKNILLNDNEIYLKNRIKALDVFSEDLEQVFILHISYLFYLNDHYMMSSDYIDSLECGLTPEENSQYFVAPFIQKVFDSTIKKHREDIATKIKENTSMMLE